MLKEVHHVVTRPGRRHGDPEVDIPVAEDLATVPGAPVRQEDVSFYTRVYPLETQNIEKAADRDWVWTVYTPDVLEYRERHDELNQPLVDAALVSGDIEPTGDAEPGSDMTDAIRLKARELGFNEVGFTRFDHHYAYSSKKTWVKYEHAICVALEQDYLQTQTLPSLEAEFAHFGTYEIEGALALDLADHIRTLGYRAQVHSPNDNSGAYIPMFINAGLGQLGANGQLLSPHFGSRARLAIITTDAPVSYDQAYRLRHQPVLQDLPGVREPLPGQGAAQGQGLVEGRREVQGHLRALPPGDGPLRGLRRVHQGLPRTALRHEARDGALRRDG